jgi:hypothetical protein
MKCQKAGKNCIARIFIIGIIHQILLRHQIMEDEMGRTSKSLSEIITAYKILAGKPSFTGRKRTGIA